MAHVEDEDVPPPTVLDATPSLSSDDADLQLQMIYLQCLAAGSYVIGHAGHAFVLDPLRDVDRYLQILDEQNLKLKAVLLSHVHADFVSGHRELARRAGSVVVSGEKENMRHGLGVMDGDVLTLSSKYRIRILETPGHTPGSTTYVLVRTDGAVCKDVMAFTGDTLFIGSCGRPDLVASQGFTKEEMAGKQFRSLEKLASLSDDVFVFPAHGAGSPCGKSLSNKLYSTIGAEKQTNPALQFKTEATFVEWLVASSSSLGIPQYFLNCVLSNKGESQDLSVEVKSVAKMTPQEFAAVHRSLKDRPSSLVLDTREPAEFGHSHVVGSVNMPLGIHGGEILSAVEGNFAIWLGTLIPPDAPLLIIAPEGRSQEVLLRIGRIGYTKNVRGVLVGNVTALQDKLELASVERTKLAVVKETIYSPRRKKMREGGPTFLDVRTGPEFRCPRKGHVDGALNVPLSGSLAEFVESLKTAGLTSDAEYIAYCSGGFRSTIAASIMRSTGLKVTDVYGGYDVTILPKHRELTTLAA